MAFSPFSVEIVGSLAAILSTICWVPQTWQTIRTQNTKSISLSANVLFFCAVSLWLVYGIALGLWPVIAANAVSVFLIGIIVILKLRNG